jgi:hypothetical protein
LPSFSAFIANDVEDSLSEDWSIDPSWRFVHAASVIVNAAHPIPIQALIRMYRLSVVRLRLWQPNPQAKLSPSNVDVRLRDCSSLVAHANARDK